MKRALALFIFALAFSGAARAEHLYYHAPKAVEEPRVTVEEALHELHLKQAQASMEEACIRDIYCEEGILRLAKTIGPDSVEPSVYKVPAELSRLKAEPAQTTGGGHSTALTWILSVDDTTTACTTTANCLQNVYRAAGSCTTTSSFSLLTTTALSSTATAFSDSTVTPGVWCYGVTFGINGLESAKDTVAVTLQPAPPSGAVATSK